MKKEKIKFEIMKENNRTKAIGCIKRKKWHDIFIVNNIERTDFYDVVIITIN